MLSAGEWYDPVSKRSHHKKKGRKGKLRRKKGGLARRDLGLLAAFDLTSRPASHSIRAQGSGGVLDQ